MEQVKNDDAGSSREETTRRLAEQSGMTGLYPVLSRRLAEQAYDAGAESHSAARTDIQKLIHSVKELLSWMPICSVGSSGYLFRVDVEKALAKFGEDGSLNQAVGVEADLKHPGNDTGGENQRTVRRECRTTGLTGF